MTASTVERMRTSQRRGRKGNESEDVFVEEGFVDADRASAYQRACLLNYVQLL